MQVRNPFQFKQFSITDSQSAMKVGTDAVLLGAWTNTEEVSTILDIGTGCGVIAIILAQRTHAIIDAIDIHDESIRDATANFMNCRWKDRLTARLISLQQFTEESNKKYDLIISNPPYFLKSLKSPIVSKTLSKHDLYLNHEELIKAAKSLLTQNGRFSVILPYKSGSLFKEFARKMELFCTRQLTIYPIAGKNPNRIIMEFSLLNHAVPDENKITIRNADQSYTQNYINLTKDFYIKF